MTNIVATQIKDSQTFGRLLRLIRQELQLSLRDIEAQTGISFVTISLLERDKRGTNFDNVCKLLKAYGWEIELKPTEASHE